MDHIDIDPSSFLDQKDRLFYSDGTKNSNLQDTVQGVIDQSISEKSTEIGRLDVDSPEKSHKKRKRKKKRKKSTSEVNKNLTVLGASSRLLTTRKANPEIKNLLKEIKLNSAKMTNMVSLT